MPYKDAYHPKVRADLKKLDRSVVKEIHNVHLDCILDTPNAGDEQRLYFRSLNSAIITTK